ncbi:Glycyl-tRNA synthetase beta subunit [Sphingomonas laterariae]|uniref:Glycyl-tRNA synthetase beta subunit n=1 Tax=Edaphosphingomonas laterariae TaxID=861865 RepID=A0A239CNF4_9SPHN|nr:Glycyl-tRNA synthetase beta subunit [Sphingomonas laterariae]
MIGLTPSVANATSAVLPSPFISDLAISVTNDGSDDAAARWLLVLTSDFLRNHGQRHSLLDAFDFASTDFEAIGDAWPMMAKMAELVGVDPAITAPLARFVAERLPAIWARGPWIRNAPVTRALILADRTHDLVGLFAAGLKPNGSKDPYALRRAANHWLMQVVCPLTVGRRQRDSSQLAATLQGRPQTEAATA